MDTVVMLLKALDSLFPENPVAYALGVIVIMITEGLLLIGIFRVIQKILIRPDTRTR